MTTETCGGDRSARGERRVLCILAFRMATAAAPSDPTERAHALKRWRAPSGARRRRRCRRPRSRAADRAARLSGAHAAIAVHCLVKMDAPLLARAGAIAPLCRAAAPTRAHQAPRLGGRRARSKSPEAALPAAAAARCHPRAPARPSRPTPRPTATRGRARRSRSSAAPGPRAPSASSRARCRCSSRSPRARRRRRRRAAAGRRGRERGGGAFDAQRAAGDVHRRARPRAPRRQGRRRHRPLSRCCARRWRAARRLVVQLLEGNANVAWRVLGAPCWPRCALVRDRSAPP